MTCQIAPFLVSMSDSQCHVAYCRPFEMQFIVQIVHHLTTAADDDLFGIANFIVHLDSWCRPTACLIIVGLVNTYTPYRPAPSINMKRPLNVCEM